MLALSLIIGGIMHRGGGRDTYNSFRNRNRKTHRVNLAPVRRGGIRL